jgi:hypothetical protein
MLTSFSLLRAAAWRGVRVWGQPGAKDGLDLGGHVLPYSNTNPYRGRTMGSVVVAVFMHRPTVPALLLHLHLLRSFSPAL